jgi:hypothetical protein
MRPPSGQDPSELLQRARRAFGGAPVVEAVPPRKEIVLVRSAVEAATLAAVDEKLAQAAVDALSNGEVPAPEQLAALEACIRFMRPALFIEGGRIQTSPAGSLPLSAQQKAALERLLPAVAALGPAQAPEGLATGFLIGPRALLTNGHVLDALEAQLGGPLRPGQVVARFGLERATVERFAPVPVRGVLLRRPGGLDAAVLELASDGPAPGALPLARAAPAGAGQVVVTVGYPQRDPLQPLFADAVFENLYGVKRAAPGETLQPGPRALYHDCSTLGGNSGSPVLDGTSAVVVGLHSTGTFAYRNEAVASAAVYAEADLRAHVTDWR